MMKSAMAFRVFGVGLVLWVSCSGLASAQNASTAERSPVPDAGTTDQDQCISENDSFRMRGKVPIFEIALENKCERRLSCRVFAYITTAKGAVQGSGTLVLAPKSNLATAKSSFTIKVKMASGNSQSARECRAISK